MRGPHEVLQPPVPSQRLPGLRGPDLAVLLVHGAIRDVRVDLAGRPRHAGKLEVIDAAVARGVRADALLTEAAARRIVMTDSLAHFLSNIKGEPVML